MFVLYCRLLRPHSLHYHSIVSTSLTSYKKAIKFYDTRRASHYRVRRRFACISGWHSPGYDGNVRIAESVHIATSSSTSRPCTSHTCIVRACSPTYSCTAYNRACHIPRLLFGTHIPLWCTCQTDSLAAHDTVHNCARRYCIENATPPSRPCTARPGSSPRCTGRQRCMTRIRGDGSNAHFARTTHSRIGS